MTRLTEESAPAGLQGASSSESCFGQSPECTNRAGSPVALREILPHRDEVDRQTLAERVPNPLLPRVPESPVEALSRKRREELGRAEAVLAGLRLAALEDRPPDPASGPRRVNEERPDPGGVADRVEKVGPTARLCVASEQGSAPAPAAASHDLAADLGDEVRPVPDELAIDAKRSLESRLDLFARVILPGETRRGLRDQLLEPGSILESGFAQREAHAIHFRTWSAVALPPVKTVATSCPASRSPWASTAASPAAPAGSSTTPRSACARRMARTIASSSTSTTSSTTPVRSSIASGKGLRTAIPSAIVSVRGSTQRRPVRSDTSIAGAPLAQTPITRVDGRCAFNQRATPARSAPSPSGTTIESNGSGHRRSSIPIVPAPSAISRSRPSSTSRAPVSRAKSRAASWASSKSLPT